MPLTSIEIKNAVPREKEYIINDGAGLVVLVKPSGAKLWRFRYSFAGKKQKLSLGSYPDTPLAQGISPVNERREQQQAGKVVNSFEGVCLEWQATRAAVWSENYAAEIKRLFERTVFPILGVRASY